MKAMTKRLLSMLVVLAMVLSMVPVVGLPAIEANAAQATADITTDADNLMNNDFKDKEGTVSATCPACGSTDATWLPLTAALGTGVVNGSHYYLPADLTSTSATKIFEASSSGWKAGTVCLHLNGKTLTTAGGFSIGHDVNTFLNVMGQGNVKYTGTGNLYTVNTGRVFLWGGTHSAPSGTVFQKIGAAGLQQFYGNTVIDGVVKMGTENGVKAQLYLRNNATIKSLQMGDTAYTALVSGWKGTIYNANIASRAADGTYSSTYVYVDGNNLTGNVFSNTGEKLIKSGKTLAVDSTYDKNDLTANDGFGWCEACSTTVKWTEMNAPLGTAVVNGGHYYLTSVYDDNAGHDTYFMKSSTDKWWGGSACLHLNGKEIETDKYFHIESNNTKLNIMGSGKITYTGNNQLFQMYTLQMNIYGGTFTCEKDVPVINQAGYGMVSLRGAAHIDGWVKMERINAGADALSQLTVYDEAKIKTLTANTKGALNIEAGWKGSIGSVTYTNSASIDAVTKLVSTDNAVVKGAFTGSIKLFDGRALEKEGTQLKAVDYAFDPVGHNNYSYCPVCKEYVVWTGINSRVGAVSDTLNHIYLTKSVNYDATGVTEDPWFISTASGKTTHFNMNGFSITPKTENVEKKPLGISVSGTMDLFNTSAEESYWSAVCASYGEHFVTGNTARFTLHDGVTLQATATNTDQPVVGILSGTFTLNGGTVTAAGKGNAMVVQARNHNTTTTAAIEVNSGEIICGTTNVAIRLGQNTTTQSPSVTAALNGGTITGGVTVNYGTVTLDKTASPSGVIKVGANGKLEVNSTWTGKAAVQFAEDLVATDTGLVNEANGYAEEGFTGELRDFATAKQLVYAGGNRLQLTATVLTPGEDVFDPEMWAGQAYCPECQTNATAWTAVDDCADKRIGIISEAGTHHYYIRDNLTCGKTGWFANAAGEGKIIHLNMNGKNVSVDESASTGGINLSGGEMEIFNTSTTVGELEVVKNSNSVYPGMVYIADGEFVLGDKVKLTGKDINGDVPFMYVLSGTFQMDGGEVSAAGMEREAVWVKKTNNKASAFIMNGGTVTGGTGDAVHVGTSTETGTVSFEMHGGTINGTVYVTEYCTSAPVLSGNPTLAVKLDNATETARLNVAGLTANASITLADVTAGVPFTTATANETNKAYFHYGENDEQIKLKDDSLYVAIAKVDGVWYATTAEAVTNAGGNVVVMGGNASVELTDAETDYYIDCAGYDITVSGSGTLYAMDSANVEFDENGKILNIDSTKCGTWTITGVAMEPVTRTNGDIYVLILNEDSATYSAHYLDIRISAVNLRTSSAGLYYTAEYKCDEKLAAKVKYYGVGLSVHEMPNIGANGVPTEKSAFTKIATDKNPLTQVEGKANTYTAYSGAVINIFTNDAENAAENAENAATRIFANAYLQIATANDEYTYVCGNVADTDIEDEYVGAYGDGAVYNMGMVLQAINTIVNTEETSDEIKRVKNLIADFRDDWPETFQVIQTAAKYDVSAIMKLETASSEENA